MTIIINLLGLLLILLIIWWFWLYKGNQPVGVKDILEIRVKDGIYQPAFIKVKINQPITLRFIREDATPCSEYVIFDKLKINKKLPLRSQTNIHLNIKIPGEYDFTCQMGMYRGKLIVSE